jgi:hypothetical protein
MMNGVASLLRIALRTYDLDVVVPMREVDQPWVNRTYCFSAFWASCSASMARVSAAAVPRDKTRIRDSRGTRDRRRAVRLEADLQAGLQLRQSRRHAGRVAGARRRAGRPLRSDVAPPGPAHGGARCGKRSLRTEHVARGEYGRTPGVAHEPERENAQLHHRVGGTSHGEVNPFWVTCSPAAFTCSERRFFPDIVVAGCRCLPHAPFGA